MKITSINVGLPVEVPWQGKTIATGIYKNQIPGPVMVRKINIDGDKQADLNVHGGVDKAVYAYSHAAYDWWKKELGISDLPPGSFGENLTVSELDESKIGIGDIFQIGGHVGGQISLQVGGQINGQIGGCQLQVVQPRQPCFKLGIKFANQGILKTFNKSGRPGIYFRVIKEGEIAVGDDVKLVKPENPHVPLAALFDFYLTKKLDAKTAESILAIPSLNASWRSKIQKYYSGL